MFVGAQNYKVSEGELNVIALLYVIYNSIRLGTCLLTNWLLAYLRKRRLILDKPNVKFFIISLQYYFALQWISGKLLICPYSDVLWLMLRWMAD